MLTIAVPLSESYDEEKNEFITEEFELALEHSLVSISKWEQFFKKPFLTEDEKSDDELWYYIQCMVLTPEVPANVWEHLTQDNIVAINDYINDKATATWFNESKATPRTSEVLTNELIYYWMFAQGIPKECELWHINRLITLLKVFNLKNSPQKKMSPDELRAYQRRVNAERRKQFETSG